MAPDAEGTLTPNESFLPAYIRQDMPELRNSNMPLWTYEAWSPPIDSSFMGPAHWIKVLLSVFKLLSSYISRIFLSQIYISRK